MKPQTNVRALSAILIFIAGIISHHIYLKVTQKSVIDNVPPSSSTLESEVRSLTQSLADAQRENAILLSKIESRPAGFSIEAIPEESHPQVSLASTAIEINGEHFRDMMNRQVDQQMDVYTARLNLTDDQRDQLGEMMLLRLTQRRIHFGPHGPLEIADNGAPLITQRDIDDLAAEILSEDQLDEYNEMQSQENASRSEMMATAQLSQIAPQLGLSESQKDQVYSIYYNQSLERSDGIVNSQQMQESQQQADEQIREILDEEQREVFRTIRENQNFGNFTIIAR